MTDIPTHDNSEAVLAEEHVRVNPDGEFDRQVQVMQNAFQAIVDIRRSLETMPRSRECSIVITKLDEAWLWAQQIPMNPPEVAEDAIG